MREKALKEVWLYDIINSDEFILGVSLKLRWVQKKRAQQIGYNKLLRVYLKSFFETPIGAKKACTANRI